MNSFWAPALLVIFANVSFHIIQKSIFPGAHPLVSVMVTYSVGIMTCALLLFFFPLKQSLFGEIINLNWASFALGVAIVGIEVGYLLMYRQGWAVSIGPVFSYGLTALLLIPLGLLFFAEKLAWQNVMGIFITIGGVYLLTWKPDQI